MMNASLKAGKWSIQYYDLFKLVGKHIINEKEEVIIGYPEICLLNIIIQLGNIKKNTQCTMKNSNFAEILNAKERQIQVYLKHLKDLGIISTFEDRLKGTKCVTTKRTIYVKYDRIKELTTCEITQVVNEPHVELGANNTCNSVSTTCEITHPYNDTNNDNNNDNNDNLRTCNSVEEIKISRTEDLLYVLDIYSMKEDDVNNIIEDNKIDDPDDFVNLLAMETQSINISCNDKKTKKDISEVVCDYFKFHRINVFKINDTFRKSDLIYTTSNDEGKKIINWYFRDGRMFQSEIEITQSCEIDAFNKIISAGNQISAYYFKRNSYHK